MDPIVGKYEVLKELGKGAYGTVYLVRHVYLGLQYALKLLSRQLSDDTHFIERFKREAEILVRFSHPGTVQLRDFGKTEQGLFYMATDYCPGEVLEDVLIRERWFPVLKSFDYMLQLLEVLESAHAMTIVHRDIKPSNIMIEKDKDGREIIKVLDFGIAKITKDVWEGSRVTGEGYAIGTPEYMSPEQASGEAEVDWRSDIYSAGIVMYELLTGQVPFRGTTVLRTLLKHMTQPVPPFAERLGIPACVEEVVNKALQKEPTERFQDATQFKAACLDALATIRRADTKARTIQIDLDSEVHSASEESLTKVVPSEPTRILCLDDAEMILHISRHIFEREGYRVFTATNFTSIYDSIFREQVQIMLCDVQMPGLPGTRVCQMLKQSIPTLKIILFSNIPDRELEKLSLECKADGWLSKNSRPDEWIAKVKELEQGIR